MLAETIHLAISCTLEVKSRHNNNNNNSQNVTVTVYAIVIPSLISVMQSIKFIPGLPFFLLEINYKVHISLLATAGYLHLSRKKLFTDSLFSAIDVFNP